MIVIYTKENCRFCDLAKSLLESKGVQYRQYMIGIDVSRDFITETFPNVRTVPIILDDNRLIGGYDNLLSELSDPNNHIGKTFLQD